MPPNLPRVIQGDTDRVLHESRNAGRSSRIHEGADPFELCLVESDRHLLGHRTSHHTMAAPG
jgi:hypothetical protein